MDARELVLIAIQNKISLKELNDAYKDLAILKSLNKNEIVISCINNDDYAKIIGGGGNYL